MVREEPEVFSDEVRTLLRKLDPKNGNHKERVRRLTRFRNYVAPAKGDTPEFYDDDIPLLMLGSQSPAAMYDEDLATLNLYGLLQASGTPSSDHEGGLKRSAKSAMGLLKFLVLDWREVLKGKRTPTAKDKTTGRPELTVFAHALCSSTIPQLRLAAWDHHLKEKDSGARGGAKDDSCAVLYLLLTRHLDGDGETAYPLSIDDLLSSKLAKHTFNVWIDKNHGKRGKDAVAHADKEANKIKAAGGDPKKAAMKAKEAKEKSNADDTDADNTNTSSHDNKSKKGKKKKDKHGNHKPEEKGKTDKNRGEQLDSLGLNLHSRGMRDAPTRWDDSELNTTKKKKMGGDQRDKEREEAEAKAEKARIDEDHQRVWGRDPLGIEKRSFDLRTIERQLLVMLEQGLKEVEDKIEADGETVATDENPLASLEAQRASLQAMVDHLTPDNIYADLDDDDDLSPEEAEQRLNLARAEKAKDKSVLPISPKFDPLLFLTLVHRNTSYNVLSDSVQRLTNKTESQLGQLQSLVRDNFQLFIRCADGLDVFSAMAEEDLKVKPMERLDKLDSLASSCSNQAKKSFKPLLDNTNEVLKVQSALAVLQRVGPIIQAPNLMRQHLENGRFSDAVKAYRRVLVIEDGCDIELLNHVKSKAAEAAREARRDLEATLADPVVPVEKLLEAIRDLGELIELEVPSNPMEENAAIRNSKNQDQVAPGVYSVGKKIINIRRHPPPTACLLLQSAHFSALVQKAIAHAEDSTRRIYEGETLLEVTNESEGKEEDSKTGSGASKNNDASTVVSNGGEPSKSRAHGNRWKYDVLEARVLANVRAVAIASNWLPRLLKIGLAAMEAERRRAARLGRRRPPFVTSESDKGKMTSFQVFSEQISPTVSNLVQHATFSALGCNNINSDGEELKMTFGENANDKLKALLRAPLPPTQSAKCATELAELVEVIIDSAATSFQLRPDENDADGNFNFNRSNQESPLEDCMIHAEQAVITVERRRCIYAFDICARNCSMRASGSGTFDGEALLSGLQKLSEELTRPEQCSNEVEKGCELVVRRICEGLASYVRDRGDTARLRAVAECATALNGSIADVVREVAYLTSDQCENVEEALAEDIMALEGAMFDEFLENIRRNVSGCCKLGWLGNEEDEDDYDEDNPQNQVVAPTTFPSYLSASLLAIVRCRAQVERALGDTTIRRSEGVTYQFLAMATAADSVIEGICSELNDTMARMRGRQADRMANELQFLINTLKNYLSDEMLAVADNCRRMLCSKAGRGGGIQGDGPDGLAAIEELERLGRVYVLCLGE